MNFCPHCKTLLSVDDSTCPNCETPRPEPEPAPIYWSARLEGMPAGPMLVLGDVLLVAVHVSSPSDERYSIACALPQAAPQGEKVERRPFFVGSFEMVDLAFFLHEHFFPLHDSLCQAETELARRVFEGESTAQSALESVQRGLEALYVNAGMQG